MSDVNFDKFKEILLAYVKNNGLPNVEYKYATSLNDIVCKMTGPSTFYPTKQPLIQNVSAMVDDLVARSDSDVFAVEAFSQLDTISKSFSDKINETTSILKTVKNIVAGLETSIDEKYQKMAKLSTVLSTATNNPADANSFNKMDWSDYLLVGSEANTVSKIHKTINVEEADPRRIYFSRIQHNLSVIKAGSNIEVDKETTDKAIATITENVKDVMPDDIRKVFNTLTKVNLFTSVISSVKNAYAFKGGVGVNLVNILWSMRNCLPVIEFMERGTLELTDSVYNQLRANAKIMDDVLLYAAYFVIVARKDICKNAVLLDNKMINPDKYDEFVKKGGEPKDIVNHLNYMYTTGVLPLTGVSLDILLSMKDQLNNRAEKDVARMAVKVRYEKNKTLKSAMQIVLREYAAENKDDFKYPHDTERKIVRTSEKQIINDTPLKDCLYNFIIDTQFPDAFVKKLMSSLGNAYIQKLAVSSEVDSSDIAITEVGVYTDMVVSFIVDNFLVNLGVLKEEDFEISTEGFFSKVIAGIKKAFMSYDKLLKNLKEAKDEASKIKNIDESKFAELKANCIDQKGYAHLPTLNEGISDILKISKIEGWMKAKAPMEQFVEKYSKFVTKFSSDGVVMKVVPELLASEKTMKEHGLKSSDVTKNISTCLEMINKNKDMEKKILVGNKALDGMPDKELQSKFMFLALWVNAVVVNIAMDTYPLVKLLAKATK